MKALIAFYGGSGSGKTLSALLLARGLVGPSGDVYMGDTENRRGEMYVDLIEGGYMVSQINAPFSSKKYIEMIAEAEAAAGDRPAALVIDSFSHEWEGEGGVLSAANAISEAKAARYNKQWYGSVDFADWKIPKQDHKELVLKMLGSPLHIIVCLRAQFKSHQVAAKDYAKHGITAKTKSVVFKDEFQTSIQDSGFIYELTVNAELRTGNAGVPILTKCPEMLLPAFDGGQITVETGQRIAKWLAGGSPATEALEASMESARIAAAKGNASYQTWWKDQTQTTRSFLVGNGKHDEFKAAADLHDTPPKSEDDGS